MYKYIFYGKVIPEGLNFGFKDNHVINVSNSEYKISGSIVFECQNSTASVIFSSENRYQEDLLPTIRNLVCEYGKLIIYIYSYCRSINCDLEIEGVRCIELNIDRKFSIQLEGDIKITTGEIFNYMQKIIFLLSKDKKLIFLKDVFADFKQAIKEVKTSGFYFYRALETIRKNYFSDSVGKSIEWKKMNEELCINETAYKNILKFSKENRHGKYPSITGDERIMLAKETRLIIEKFINYLEKNLN